MQYQVTAELKTWLESQLQRGCAREGLIDALQQTGHTPSYANWLVRNTSNPSPRTVQIPPPFDENILDQLRTHASSAPNSIDVNGHSIDILLALNNPRTVLFGNFLSAAECDTLIAASTSKLNTSLIVDKETGVLREDTTRISEGTYFSRGETSLVSEIEKRVAFVLGFELSRQEPLQILHYGVGGRYDAHYDYFDVADSGSAVAVKNGGQRVATLVMYLNDVELGGATIFPRLALEVKPRKGHAVYFESMDDEGAMNPNTLHMGAPVGQGEKWIATKWIRETAYGL